MSQPFIHQTLVSPELGGAEVLALQIQMHLAEALPNFARLLIPSGAVEAERQAKESDLDFVNYDLAALTSHNRLEFVSENLRLRSRFPLAAHGIWHVHSPFVFAAARVFRSLTRLKSLLHIHLDYSTEQMLWPLKSPPDMVVLCAHSIRQPIEDAFEQLRQPLPEFAVVPNAIDHKRFYPGDKELAKRALGLSPGEAFIVMVANLAEHKGQATAIRAINQVVNHEVPVKLWLVGSDRDPNQSSRSKLEGMVADMNIGGIVNFAGFRSDIPEILRAADIFLLPSTSEAMPLGIIEAQASKAVVLAAPAGDTAYIVKDGKTGFVIAADNVDGYSQRILDLIARPEKRAAVADAAYQAAVENHQLDRYCERIVDVYRTLAPEVFDT